MNKEALILKLQKKEKKNRLNIAEREREEETRLDSTLLEDDEDDELK